MGIYITIKDPASLKAFLMEAKGVGLLKDVSLNDMSFREDDFPMDFPVDIDAFLKLAGNPVVKKVFGKKIESSVKGYLVQMGAG